MDNTQARKWLDAAWDRVLKSELGSPFARVLSQGVNVADSLTGVPGDVMCFDDDNNMILAVEVKDRMLTLSDVRNSARKAQASTDKLSNFLFATPGFRNEENNQIREVMATAWASGLNINQIDIVTLASMAFALLSEDWRPKLLREIGKELDERGDPAHRHARHIVLLGIGEEPA